MIFSFNFLLIWTTTTSVFLSTNQFTVIFSTFNILRYSTVLEIRFYARCSSQKCMLWERVSISLAFLIHAVCLFWNWQCRNNFWVDLLKDGIATGETEKQPEASLERVSEKIINKIKQSSGLEKNGFRDRCKVGTELQHPCTPKLWVIWG